LLGCRGKCGRRPRGNRNGLCDVRGAATDRFDFIFARELARLEREELAEAGRAVINVVLPPTMAIARDGDEALRLMDRHICAAHTPAAASARWSRAELAQE
jgi:hypothetical protein